MVNISPLPRLYLAKSRLSNVLIELLHTSTPPRLSKIDPLEQFVTGISPETVISKRVLMAIWIGNVNDMGIENPFRIGST